MGFPLSPAPTIYSPTPAGCPSIQPNSDSIYLEMASGPTGQGAPGPLHSAVASPGCPPCFRPTGYKTTGSYHLLLGGSLVQSTREAHRTEIICWITGLLSKDRPQEQPAKRGTGPGWGKGSGASIPSARAPLSQHLPEGAYGGQIDYITGWRQGIQPVAPLPSQEAGGSNCKVL